MKKLLLLGGSRYLLPVIREAREFGIYTITCDYLPDNEAHSHSDEYRNVSIIDKEAVLAAARELEIDGVLSFACDPGVTTCAYVAEMLGLPGPGPYKSVCVLQDKARFRAFLSEHGFTVPHARGFSAAEEAIRALDEFTFPLMVKPVDSAGSKGVTRVDSPEAVPAAIARALEWSHCGEFIIEEFIDAEGFPSDTDCFSYRGELVFASFNSQRFDAAALNPYAPAGFTWPASMSGAQQRELRGELQRLLSLLKMDTSLYNVECRVGRDGKAYLMEVSPRGGGNRLCEMLHYACGTNLIKNAVMAAVGMEPEELSDPVYTRWIGQVILHSYEAGHYKGLSLPLEIRERLIEEDVWVREGEYVEPFAGANKSFGTLVIAFDSEEQMLNYMNSISDWCKIILEE